MTTPLELTLQQAAAYDILGRFALGRTESSMAVLDGPAGTGKTFLASHVIKCAVDAGLSVAIAAPTNKAVQVLREKMEAAGITVPDESIDSRLFAFGRSQDRDEEVLAFGSIQGILGMRMREFDNGEQKCEPQKPSRLHKYDLVVVDECSMVGMEMFKSIAANKRQTRILFVGDSSQLPPIGPGKSNDEISPTFTLVTMRVSLNEIVRQQADNPVIVLASCIRRAIENTTRITSQEIRAVLPPLDQDPRAAFIYGTDETIITYMLHEIAAGRNARVIAYHDRRVEYYNRTIHERLHGGPTEFPFVVGQRVIVDKQRDATPRDDPSGSVKLITSEEATVCALAFGRHPYHRDIPACLVTLDRDYSDPVTVYVANDQAALSAMTTQCFEMHRKLKASAQHARTLKQHEYANDLYEQAKDASDMGWSLSRNFVPLRHAYAMTSHKAQGSTYDTVFVDFADLVSARGRISDFTFNRSLYVAITRPSKFMAIVSSMGNFA